MADSGRVVPLMWLRLFCCPSLLLAYQLCISDENLLREVDLVCIDELSLAECLSELVDYYFRGLLLIA